MDILQQLGTALGLGLMSGVRLYLTLLAIGAAIRFQWLQLNESFAGLNVLADWRVMAVAGAACAIEFIADKVPWVDSAWDSLHTFIRPVGAALLGASAFANTDPAIKAMLMIVCGGVALTGHSAKSATRLAVNHSPEPFSNIALSLAGDAAIPVATWFTFQYPLVTLAVVAVFVAAAWWLSPKIFRMMRLEFATVGGMFQRWFGTAEEIPAQALKAFAGIAPPAFQEHLRAMPLDILEAVRKKYDVEPNGLGVRCAAGRGVNGLRSSIGYLTATQDREKLVFVTRRWFRFRFHEVLVAEASNMNWKSYLTMDSFTFEVGGKTREFEVFRVAPPVEGRAAREAAA